MEEIIDDVELLVEQETAKYFSSYLDLVQVVNDLRFMRSSENDIHTTSAATELMVGKGIAVTDRELPQILPNEICTRIVQYLLVPRVQMKDVTAIGCSSIYSDRMILWNRNNNNIKNKTILDRLASLANCLNDDEDTWWISGEGLDIRPQYVDFCCVPSAYNDSNTDATRLVRNKSMLATSSSTVRIQSVSIKIPPLPHGPMSVREFIIQRSNAQYCRNRSADNQHSTIVVHDNDDDDEKGKNRNNTTTAAVEWETISPTWSLQGNTSGYQTFTFPVPGVDVTHIRVLCLSNQISADDSDRTSFRQSHVGIQPEIPQSVGFYSIRFD